MTVSPLEKWPGWTRLLVTAVISAVCSAGIIAGILVLALTQGPEGNNNSGTVPPGGQGDMADDAGGGAVIDTADPLSPPPASPSVQGHFTHAAVAVDSTPCPAIGKDVLAKRGTAVDAAVAVLFCNGVVTSQSMGIGGGFVMTIHLSNGTAVSLVAREMAPAAVTRDMFSNTSSTLGPRTSGVPGEVKGYWEAKQRFGNPELPWAELIQPSIDLCENGITITRHAENALKRSETHIRKDPGLSSVFLDPETEEPLRTGDVYKHPKLGETLRKIAEAGADTFYSGEVGRELIQDIQEAGGIMTSEDLASYRVSWEEPVRGRLPHTDYTVISSPPPASGSVMLAILGIAGQYSPLPPDVNRVTSWHRFIEACKFAYAKRTLLGDWSVDSIASGVREVVSNMTSEAWWSETIARISDTATNTDPRWYGAEFSSVEDSGTAHMSILSPQGDAVSVTSTVNLLYGSKFMSPRTGIVLNNQMDDFSYPGLVNAFGVPPSESNMVAPGKRPVSSMSPTIVVDSDNRVVAIVGASGGTKIITSVAQVIYRMVYMGQSVKEAVDARRLHHQLVPMRIVYEEGVTRWLVDGLRAVGHEVSKSRVGGSIIQAVQVDRETGDITANADFRKGGTVAGF